MAKRISRFILIVSLLSFLPATAQRKLSKALRDSTKAKEREYKKAAKASVDSALNLRKKARDSSAKRNNPDTLAFQKNVRVGLDFGKPLSSALGSGRTQFEVSFDYHYRNRYFLSAEAGLEKNLISRNNVYSYSSFGQYIRAGFDYSVIHFERAYDSNIIYIGLRLAAANVRFSAKDITVGEDYFGASIATLPPASAQAFWLEAIFGIKVQLLKRIAMGWTLRLGSQTGDLTKNPTYPVYIPGYGKSSDNQNITYNYSVFYTF